MKKSIAHGYYNVIIEDQVDIDVIQTSNDCVYQCIKLFLNDQSPEYIDRLNYWYDMLKNSNNTINYDKIAHLVYLLGLNLIIGTTDYILFNWYDDQKIIKLHITGPEQSHCQLISSANHSITQRLPFICNFSSHNVDFID